MTSMTSVLIVDDEPAVRDLMARWVTSLGMHPHTASDADSALDTVRTTPCDLAVIDVMMPGHDGLWLAAQMQRKSPHTALVIATGFGPIFASDGECPPIADFLMKPFQRDRFALAVDRGRQWRKQALGEMQWHTQLTIELDDRKDEICEKVRAQTARGAVSEGAALMAVAMSRLTETAAHSERVARYARSVARELGLSHRSGDSLEVAARFHDIGKAAIPDALLTKPSPLTPDEMAIMRRHVDIGAEILAASMTLCDAAPIVLATHEWFGGGGYPLQLAGSAIPVEARIIAVVDAYDAMTQDRAYRSRMDSGDAVSELLRCTPTQFDPEVVAAFLAVLGRH